MGVRTEMIMIKESNIVKGPLDRECPVTEREVNEGQPYRGKK